MRNNSNEKHEAATLRQLEDPEEVKLTGRSDD